MTYSSWELRKPHHGSNLFVPVPNLSNQALKEGECRSVYFLSSSGGKKHSDAIFGVKIKGGKILGKDGQFLEPLYKVFGASDPDFSAASDLVATRLNSHTELSFVLQHNEQLKPFGTHYYHSACTLDIMSKELKPFKPPKQYKKDALLISAYGKLFHLALSAFEVYDPQACSWKSCSPFPHYQKEEWSDSKMLGYAICYGCILVSVLPPDERDDEPRESPLWVYEVTSDQWREVKVPVNHNSDYYYPFIDKGVVIDDTIYARSVDVIVAFSLIRTQMADGGMEYSVSKPQKLHGLRTCFDMDSDIYRKGEIFNMDPDCFDGSMRLVHLGGLNFCFLQTIMKYFTPTQRVFITTFDIVYKEGKRRIRTLDATMRKVDISSLQRFFIESGFTLECEEGKEIIGTSSMMQPADDTRLCKLQQAVHDKIRKQKRRQRQKNSNLLQQAVNDKIRKQKRRQRQKNSKLNSRKITLLGYLFKPFREPKFGVY